MDINDNIKNRADLKSYFIKNAIPTESNFAEFIESTLNQREDGLVKLPGAPLSVEATGDASSQKKAINLYTDFTQENPDWVLSLNPRSDPANPATARPGFSISDAGGNSRLFVDPAGNVGIGNITPDDELDVAGKLRILTDTNPLRFTSAWSNFPAGATNQAEISNDTVNHKTLMIVGNRSAGGVRRVSVWDRLELNGDLAVNGSGNLEFGASVRQMINLYQTSYGLGVQSATQYFRTNKNFAWFKGGVHNNGELNPGGGTLQMVIQDRNVGIGTATPLKQLHIQEGAISAPLLNEARRPGIALTGQYPELNLFSRVNNGNHGPTIRLGSYDADTGNATKQWTIGTSGRNSRFLDIGFSTNNNGNPHNGIRNNQGNTVLTLLENGNMGVGTLAPSAKLHIASGPDVSLTNGTGFLMLGNAAAQNLAIDNNEIMSRNNGVITTLHLQAEGGNVSCGDTVSCKGLIIESPRTEHLNKDGALYRYSGQVYLVVDDNLYIRDSGGNTKFHFDTNSGIVRQQGWQAVSFTNGWVNYGGTYNPAGYFKDSLGIVHLRGLVKSGGIGKHIFILPAGFRPQYRELQPVQTNSNTIGRVDVLTDGRVHVGAGNAGWLSLDGITFRAY